MSSPLAATSVAMSTGMLPSLNALMVHVRSSCVLSPLMLPTLAPLFHSCCSTSCTSRLRLQKTITRASVCSASTSFLHSSNLLRLSMMVTI
jgi:hypothetical protein